MMNSVVSREMRDSGIRVHRPSVHKDSDKISRIVLFLLSF